MKFSIIIALKRALFNISNYWGKRLNLSLFLILIGISSTYAQIFLQIETTNNPRSIRLAEGQRLIFATKEYPDTWRSEIIQELDYERGMIILEEGFYKLEELEKIRLTRSWAKAVGYGMMQFSAGWYLFGGIATLSDPNYNMSEREIVIGGIFAGVGYLIKTIFYKRTLKLGKKHRLRIVDIRLFNPEPTQSFSPLRN